MSLQSNNIENCLKLFHKTNEKIIYLHKIGRSAVPKLMMFQLPEWQRHVIRHTWRHNEHKFDVTL